MKNFKSKKKKKIL